MTGLAVAACVALLGPAEVSGRQPDGRRIALVVTNNSAGPDIAAGGEAMSRKLSALGYAVVSASNAGQRDFDRAIGQVEGQADGSTIVAIYYAGFGVRANSRDYLVPAGVAPASAADLAASAIDLDDTVQRLRAKGAVVTVFLDACPSSMMLNALGGVCAGDPGRRTPDVYLVSSAARMRPGDLTAQLPGLLTGGRSVAQTFKDLETAFGSIAVVQVPAPPSPRAGSANFGVAAPVAPAAPVPVAPPPAPPPAPVQPVAAPQPQPTAPSPPADAVDMVTFLTDLLDLTDAAEAQKARALATEFNARYGAELNGVEGRGRYTVEATLAYVNGDYEKALRAIEAIRAAETAQNLPSLSGNQERRRNRLEGSIYLRLGLPQLAIPRLQAEEKSYIDFTDNASKSGPVWTRLGEAYRLAGRRSEAREMLKNAERVQSRGGKGLAYVQLSLLAYDEGDFQNAADTANTAIDILNGPPAMSGLADAYIAFAKARFKLRPRDEGEAWLYIDLARELDRGSAAANAFEAELPARLMPPSFASMRPQFTFRRDIEGRALTCYDTPEALAAYLATITAESNAAGQHLSDINGYVQRLTRLLGEYEARGYLENFEGSVKGRGYPYRTQIIAEQNAWTGVRWGEITGRIAALTDWYKVAMRAEVPCNGVLGSRMPMPSTYQPRIPSDSFSGAAATTPLASVAPAPFAAPPQRIIAPPQAAAPQPSLVITAPPPAPLITSPSVAAAPAPPPARVVTPQPAAAPVVTAPPPPPAPVTLAAVSPPPPAVSVPPQPTPRPAPTPPPAVIVTPSPQPQAAVPPPPAPRPAPAVVKPDAPSPATVATPPPPARTVQVAESPPPPQPTPAVIKPAPPPAGPPKPSVQPAAPPRPTPAPAPTPIPAPVPAATTPGPAGMLAAPPSILLAIAPAAQTTPAAPPPPAPAVKGKAAAKPAPPPTTGPQAAKAALDRATAQMSQGAYDQAQREYAAAAAADPGNSEARAGVIAARALGKLQAGQVQAAVDDLNASIALRPLPEAYEALGRIYAANGTRGAAVDSFNEAIRLRPNYAQAYFGRAEARRERAAPLRDMTELQQAADDYAAVLVVKSDLPEALYGLGVTRFLLNDYAAAVESFDGVLRVRPMFADAKYARARARFELTQYQEALKDIVDLPATFDAYARGCSAGMAFFALGDAALVARDEPRAIELFNLSSRAFAGGLAARPDDPRIKFWSLLSSQNAVPGLAGAPSRAKERLIMQFTPGKPRPAPAPTATLVHADACRRT